MRYLLLTIFLFTGILTNAQDNLVRQTFKSTRVINTHSVETLQKKKLDVRIGHRFGDLAGDNGGWGTFYGLENAADVLIGLEYGVLDRLTVGLSRTKGAGPHKMLLNGQIKYRLLWQEEAGMPFSLTFLAGTGYSTMKSGNNPEVLNFFEKSAHRFSYVFQAHLARKFGERFSLQLSPSYVHRNVVPYNDENGLFSMGVASRIQLSKVYAIILDATYPFSSLRNTGDNGYYMPLGIGLEIDTGGHVFQINLTNAGGMAETDYIPYTRQNWGAGEFRLGFTISRLFNL